MRKFLVGLVAVVCVATLSAFGQNKVVFDNQSGDPALVKVIGPTQCAVEVPSGAKVDAQASAGRYTIKVRYGTAGKYRYAKGEEFTVTETPTARSETTITLHKVLAGNYETLAISEDDFGRTEDVGTANKALLVATSNSVHYVIRFTATSGVAPTGSFDYDSSKPSGAQFRNFLINWTDARFDFTWSANNMRWCDGKNSPNSQSPGKWSIQCAPIGGSMTCLPTLSYTPLQGEERSIAGTAVTATTMGGVANGTWYVQ